MEEKGSSSLMHDFTGTQTKKKAKSSGSSPMKFVGIFLVVILLGIGSGYAIASSMKGTTASKAAGAPTYSVSSGKTFGVDDIKDFPDIAQGSLKTGGIEGEGAFQSRSSWWR